MTNKQRNILLFAAFLSILVLASIYVWQFSYPMNDMPKNNMAASYSDLHEPDSTKLIDEPGSIHDQPSWPTITPRDVSAATSTPEKPAFQQVDNYQQVQTQLTHTPTIPVEITATQSPTAMDGESSLASAESTEDNTPFSIGKSVEGRDLWVHKFGNGTSKKLIVAGIHGGYEYNTVDLANQMIDYLQANPALIPYDTTIYIFPSFNPDGLARSHGYAGRANSNNVDLNRNWDYNWKNTWEPAGCWAYLPISGGTEPFSEPETSALRDFILSHDIEAIISYHSAALGIFPGGAPLLDVSYSLAEAISAVAPYAYPPIQTGCETTGQFVDYISSFGIPAVDVELTNHRDSDFEINLEILRVFLAWHQ